VRAIIPGVLKDEQFSLPIGEAFAKYPADAFEFVVGSAEASDLDAKTVRVRLAGGEDRVLSYDHLVLATGTRCAGETPVPWKAAGSHEDVMALLHGITDKVKAAKHIVVAGGGATGVELAGELGFEFGGKGAGETKEIVMVSGGDKLLGGDICAAQAEAELKKLGVTVRNGARVEATTTLPDGRTEITLQGGDKLTTDLYLPTLGMLPNTEYLPENVLKADKFVAVDEFYRVKNATNVWAAGDIVWQPRGGFIIADKQVSFPRFIQIASVPAPEAVKLTRNPL
jgi:apoptosis-inducing factor 2